MDGDTTHPWTVTASDLRGEMRRELARDADAVLVTVADVEGAAYRRPGAKMLVDGDGTPVGAVTAGCLEDAVTASSMEVLDADEPRLVTFDLLEDDDSWGLGLGCNGVLDVLLEPLDASWGEPLDELDAGRAVTVLTVVESTDSDVPVGARSYTAGSSQIRGVAERAAVPDSVVESAASAVSEIHGRDRTTTVDVETDRGSVAVLVDGLVPVSTLLLVGSQPDVHPVARAASNAGFEVVVHSPRGARGPEDFPHADRVETGHPSTVDASAEVPEHTYAVVMTHNLVDDRIAVETLLRETSVPYVGLMGPRDRFERLREDSDVVAGTDPGRIATPVGLDLGGGAPTEIALSIVSEALAVSNGREGTRLRDEEGSIHARVEPEQ
ncbi:XdhC family protein [Halomarina litorea]|uniref:XdhC family protein n=1 Tax=Halomarina litorea TaxID=2961595 RepID=UPI0020C534DF|nr:XdhC family protein [Halomarina sp. BCD28]